MSPLLRISVALVFFSRAGYADTRPTHEAMAVDEIRAGFIGYADVNGGLQATNWNQLRSFVDLLKINRRLALAGESFPVESNYVFVTDYSLPTRSKGNIVLLRYAPFEHPTYGPGRYFVSCREHEFLSSWLDEPDFQKLLAQSGVKLPEPNPEEVRAAKVALETLIAREQIEHQMIVAAAPKPTSAEIGAVWWWRIKSSLFVYTENGHFTGRPRPLGIFTALGLLALIVYGWRARRT